MNYLARAHFIKGHERKSLRQHGTGEISLCEYERDDDCAEGELGDEGEGFER